jgi:hypothetical protein
LNLYLERPKHAKDTGQRRAGWPCARHGPRGGRREVCCPPDRGRGPLFYRPGQPGQYSRLCGRAAAPGHPGGQPLGDAAMRQDYYEYTGDLKKWKDPGDAWQLTEAEKKRGKLLEESINRRQKIGVDKVDFDPEGAILPVKVDNLPPDLPATLYVFERAK